MFSNNLYINIIGALQMYYKVNVRHFVLVPSCVYTCLFTNVNSVEIYNNSIYIIKPVRVKLNILDSVFSSVCVNV